MTTADYPLDMFLEMAGVTRALLPEAIQLVANIGDFSEAQALALKAVGCTGVYHICRLREGRDTDIPPESREATLAAALKAGLEIYYCIEPVGPEHDYTELTREIMRARTLDVKYMAAMRRVPVPGTPLADKGQISALELTKIAAVVNLAVRPSVSMNVHEPMQMPLLAGVNQVYAESGANPRDTKSQTELGRGFSPRAAWKLLAEGGWYRQV
jgi:biotin synthase